MMTMLAVASLLASAATAYAIGMAVIARHGTFLRTKRGIGLLVLLGLTFLLLPPQITLMDAEGLSGGGMGAIAGLEWPAAFSKSTYLIAWIATSLLALLAGMRIWKAGSEEWREGSRTYDSSAASRVSGLLPLADSLPAALDVIARAGLSERDVPRAAGDIREAGRRLANALPPSDGAVYSMVAAKMAPAVAAQVTGLLLEGAGRRGAGKAAS